MRKWLLRTVLAIVVLLALTVGIPMLYIEGMCRPTAGAVAATAPSKEWPDITEAGYRRNEDNTFFTFPEWYIVYSFEDFGRFLERGSESGFGYGGHILGFWRSFCTINRAVPDRAEGNFDVKSMIYVIGISYSAEYAIKGLYENTIGRISESVRGSAPTPQDVFARATLRDYADFLYTVPWYKYPFRDRLGEMFTLSAPTSSRFRSWEREFALGAEYGIKMGYAALIQKALDASGDAEARHIMFVTAPLSPEQLARESRLKPIRLLSPSWQLVQAPRYKAFTEILQALIEQGQPVAEIAGNREIFITVVAPKTQKLDVADAAELFAIDLDARPGFQRVGMRAKIDRLVEVNRALKARQANIEHYYDY
jgi:hypothetical protein